MLQRLFVYGTLVPGGPNHHILSKIGGDWVPASVRGRLREAGWGAKMGYSAMVLEASADPVAGYVFASENLGEHWNELDAFEGGEYERVIALAQLPGEATVEVFIYVLRNS